MTSHPLVSLCVETRANWWGEKLGEPNGVKKVWESGGRVPILAGEFKIGGSVWYKKILFWYCRKNALAEQNLTHKEAWRYCSSRRKNNGNRAAPVGNKQWKKRLYTFSIDNSKQQYSRSCFQWGWSRKQNFIHKTKKWRSRVNLAFSYQGPSSYFP